MKSNTQASRELSKTAMTTVRISFGLLAMLALFSCSNDGSSRSTTPAATPLGTITAAFTASGTASTPDLVRLTGATAGDTITVEVVLGGATTSQDIYSYAFDLLLGDAAVARYVPNSISVGNSLSTTGGQTTIALASENGNRVTVGVTKSGSGGGNGVASPEEVVVRLDFQVLQRTTTTLALEGSGSSTAAALDSNGAIIGSVQFDVATAQITGA